MDNKSIAATLRDIGTLLELKGENTFKVRAYINGSRVIESLDKNISDLVESGEIKEIKGIGAGLAGAITELVTTGQLPYYQELKDNTPPGLIEMLKIPGLGPKKIHKLYNNLEITSVAELEYACKENRLLELAGFGPKSQDNIIKGIDHIKKFQGQFLAIEAFVVAQEIVEAMKDCDQTEDISIAGSLRRHKEIVKDIDLVVATTNSQVVMDYFTSLSQAEEVVNKGAAKSSIFTKAGINVDLRAVTPAQYPYTLHHFTGSKEHNTALRQRAKQRGIKINEYGLFKGEDLISVENEEEFFTALGLDYIPPELRENQGEIEAAAKGNLPELVTINDIQGVFHLHTNYSDGSNTIAEMATYAKDLGLKYIGISDHSQTAVYANGLKNDALKKQKEEIDQFNAKNPDFHIFHGIESEIHSDGSLDYPDEILAEFDFVVASVHSNFNITGDAATQRLIKAIENPYTTILGHPTGRLLLGRPGCEPDIEALIAAAKDNNVVIELNASPHRLDLDWRYLKQVKNAGVMVSISPDAHRKEELNNTILGVQMARKGWLEKENIFNALSLDQVKKTLAGKPS